MRASFFKALKSPGSMCWPTPRQAPIMRMRRRSATMGQGVTRQKACDGWCDAPCDGFSRGRSRAYAHPSHRHTENRPSHVHAHTHADMRGMPVCLCDGVTPSLYLFVPEREKEGKGRHTSRHTAFKACDAPCDGHAKPLKSLEKGGF